jgi:hypothetical protein
MKHKGLSWDGGKKRTIAAFALAAVMVLPGVAQARTLPTPVNTPAVEVEAGIAAKVVVKTPAGLFSRGVSWG